MDIVYGRAYLESLDWVDKNNIGVIGGSYGGYMTAAALTFHPEVFDVGINIFGVTNWERTLQSIPDWWGAFREALYDEMGDPETDAERHHRISPLFHADQVTKPLLVIAVAGRRNSRSSVKLLSFASPSFVTLVLLRFSLRSPKSDAIESTSRSVMLVQSRFSDSSLWRDRSGRRSFSRTVGRSGLGLKL